LLLTASFDEVALLKKRHLPFTILKLNALHPAWLLQSLPHADASLRFLEDPIKLAKPIDPIMGPWKRKSMHCSLVVVVVDEYVIVVTVLDMPVALMDVAVAEIDVPVVVVVVAVVVVGMHRSEA
jgi:hypothetical protein